MVTCSGCGAVSSDTVRFCPSCGRALASLDTPTLEPDEIAVVLCFAAPPDRTRPKVEDSRRALFWSSDIESSLCWGAADG